jgi:hypothetical protein
MQFDIDPTTRRQGRAPHELAMLNLLVFNLGLCVAIRVSSMLQKGSPLEHYKSLMIAAPLLASLAIIAFTFYRAAKGRAAGPWFPAAHWGIAAGRYRFLLIAYLVVGSVLGLGWLISLSEPKLHSIIFIALTYVAVVMMLIPVMVLAVLESSSLSQAGNGEVPDGVIKRMPPPADLVTSESVDRPAAD